jgi:sterol O-acyltransferase
VADAMAQTSAHVICVDLTELGANVLPWATKTSVATAAAPCQWPPAPVPHTLYKYCATLPREPATLSAMPQLRPQTSREDSWTPDASTAVSETHVDAPTKHDSRMTIVPLDDDIDVALAGERAGEDEGTRAGGVQVTIEEPGKKGRYLLRADDAEFRDILRSAIEREAGSSSGKSRSRIRDYVFTRQFTTFDRQNPRASQSPFHGFFTLFWLAMALLLIRIAAQNYRDQGSVFGTAEIVHLMVDRDLILMLATDGLMVLCSITFSLALQKCIAKDYLTWDRSGWIIQSVWQMVFTATFIWITFFRDWTWTHTVFLVMHDIVLLMKQHSYGFYNGYRKSLL